MASELASNAEDQQNAQNIMAPRSLAPSPINVLASRTEQAPENPIPYAEIVSIMWDSATHI